MTSSKPLASPARLAELALQNGWSPEEVALTFRAMIGQTSRIRAPDADPSKATEGSNILQREFSRIASAKR